MSLLQRSLRLPDETAFKDVVSTQIASVEIFPAIGVARLGNSKTEYFIGPELPIDNDTRGNSPPTADNKIRDSEGNIRRQAARFRVYAYKANGDILGEVNEHNGYKLKWTVHVVNSKAVGKKIRVSIGDPRNPHVTGDANRKKLIVDPDQKEILRKDGGEVVLLNGQFRGADVNLGQLQVDDAGRLVFIPAEGKIHGDQPKDTSQASLDTPNCVDDVCDGWVDVTVEHTDSGTCQTSLDSLNCVHDVCDGWVNVPVEHTDSGTWSKVATHKAAVLSGPPKFSWGLRCPVSMFDRIEDLYSSDSNNPDFNMHIWPILEAASLSSWVNEDANVAHRPSTRKRGDFISHRQDLQDKEGDVKYKEYIFDKLRNPDGGGGDMPGLSGPRDISLTQLQYGRFKQWKQNNFIVTPPRVYEKLEEVPRDDQPEYLTRANLEMTIGGSFNPGIEASNKVNEKPTYLITDTLKKTRNYRVKFSGNNCVNPGDFSQGLAVPWQADFANCARNWWPAVRPVKVKPKWGVERLDWDRGAKAGKIFENWMKLGFITKPYTQDDSRFESERTLQENA